LFTVVTLRSIHVDTALKVGAYI